jgi:hypothetical protein
MPAEAATTGSIRVLLGSDSSTDAPPDLLDDRFRLQTVGNARDRIGDAAITPPAGSGRFLRHDLNGALAVDPVCRSPGEAVTTARGRAGRALPQSDNLGIATAGPLWSSSDRPTPESASTRRVADALLSVRSPLGRKRSWSRHPGSRWAAASQSAGTRRVA